MKILLDVYESYKSRYEEYPIMTVEEFVIKYLYQEMRLLDSLVYEHLQITKILSGWIYKDLHTGFTFTEHDDDIKKAVEKLKEITIKSKEKRR